MKINSFILEGRAFFRQQNCRKPDCTCVLGPGERQNPFWVLYDLVSEERHCLGPELPPEIQIARTARDDLRPQMTAVRLRLKEIEQALGRLDRGDPLRPADRAMIAACGFGTALIGGAVARLREWGRQLLRGVLCGPEPQHARQSVSNRRGIDLSDSKLIGADLSGADLSYAILRGADMGAATLDQVDLTGADMTAATLARATAKWADMRAATLHGADLREANLLGANLNGADLKQANLMRANLDLSTLDQANLVGTVVDFALLTREQKHQAMALPDTPIASHNPVTSLVYE